MLRPAPERPLLGSQARGSQAGGARHARLCAPLPAASAQCDYVHLWSGGLQPALACCKVSCQLPHQPTRSRGRQVCIFTKGGALLWTWQMAALRGLPVDALIRTCLLEERSGEASFSYTPPSGAAYTLKWTLHNVRTCSMHRAGARQLAKRMLRGSAASR